MDTKSALTSLPASDWEIGQVIVFDWSDGPRQGVARLNAPRCEFAFEFREERYNPDGLDDRLFRVSELPEGSVDGILAAIHPLGRPANSVWVPTWNFGSDHERVRADREIEDILSLKRDTGLVIQSQDMTTILGCWPEEIEYGLIA